MFSRFDRMHERDGHTDTDRQTDRQTPHDDIGRFHSIARQKWYGNNGKQRVQMFGHPLIPSQMILV